MTRAAITTVMVALAVLAVILAYSGVTAFVYMPLLVASAMTACALPVEYSVYGYVATLGVQVFAGTLPLRICVGDFFMVTAAARTVARSGWSLPRSSLRGPLILFLAALTVSTIVGVLTLHALSSYVVFNKDLGALYLVAGFLTLAWWFSDPERLRRGAAWFVGGVSIANVTALAGAVLAFAGVRNPLYLTGNMRLYGWTMNANLFGSVLLMGAMLELAALTGVEPVRARRWRLLNLGLLALSIVLTLSRGTWLAVAAGGGVLFLLRVFEGGLRVNRLRTALAGVWVLAWGAALGGLVLGGALRGGATQGADYAAQLRARFLAECRANPSRDACVDVRLPAAGEHDAVAAPAREAPELLPDPTGQTNVRNAATQLTNSRGVDDRLAILQVAAVDYTAGIRQIVLGTGLDTFRARSANRFGLPLIIHNTFAWALFEMGIAGLLAVLWLWGRTAGNLVRAWRRAGWRADLAAGLLCALVGLTVFCLLNDGMYERHLWLLFVLADRLETC